MTITVKQLRHLLSKMPPTAIAVVANDAELSDVMPLGVVMFGYWDQREGHGEFHEVAAVDDPYDDWSPTGDSVFAVCLTPEE